MRRMLVLIALVIACWINSAAGGGAGVPPGAAALGYTKCVINERPTAADIAPGRNGDYKWFSGQWWNSKKPPLSEYSTQDGMLAVSLGGDLVSAPHDFSAGKLPLLPGRDGFYVEFEYWLSDGDPDHWPAVWLMPAEHNGRRQDRYADDPPGYERWMELDVDEGGFGPGLTGTVHSSCGIYEQGWQHIQNPNNVSRTALDRTKKHIFGVSYDPHSQRATWWVDGAQQMSAGAPYVPEVGARQSFYLIISAQTHGKRKPYSLFVSAVRAYVPPSSPVPAGKDETRATVPAVSLSEDNIHLRGEFQNARIRFEREKKGHVAFLGGSITEMDGSRPMVMKILQRRFPQTQFTFTDAGVASTCSTTGAFRLQDDVLSQGPVDLLFIEFAVNDDQDAHHPRRDCIRGMEGIVRHTRLHNPYSDIVITYFVNPDMLATWQAGQVPLSVSAHREVAEHYQIPTINLAKEVADRITAGTLTWQQYGGTHPKPLGNGICASMIDHLMSLAWTEPLPADIRPVAHPLPEDLLDKNSYWRGRLIAPDQAKVLRDMTVEVPDWPNIRGQCRTRFVQDRLLCASKPGAELALDFAGTAIGAYVLAGPDAGIVEASIDGGPCRPFNLFHAFSVGLHYPRTVLFDADLPPGEHRLHLRISADNDERSTDHALRVLHFVAN
jgi:lysophospholipase L1-like esterase